MNNNTIGSRLKLARVNANVTVKEISDFLVSKGLKASPNTIYSWENNNSQPTPDALLFMCKKYGIADVLSYFNYEDNKSISKKSDKHEESLLKKYRFLSFGGKKAVDNMIDFIFNLEQEQKRQDNILDINIRRLPLYAVPASAGTGNFLDDSPYEIIEVGADAPMQTSYLLRASGDSMEPKIQDGDTLYIKQQNFVEDGEIGIFWYDGQVYVKKFERHGNASYLVSLNPKYAPIKVNGDPIRCYGKVLNK